MIIGTLGPRLRHVSIAVAGAVAFPVNRSLIAHGKGHVVVHAHHGQHERSPG